MNAATETVGRHLARSEREDAACVAARVGRLRAMLPGLVDALVGFGARRVWLLGSLVDA